MKKSANYITKLLEILNIILNLLLENKFVTKREIYYLNCKLFES